MYAPNVTVWQTWHRIPPNLPHQRAVYELSVLVGELLNHRIFLEPWAIRVKSIPSPVNVYNLDDRPYSIMIYNIRNKASEKLGWDAWCFYLPRVLFSCVQKLATVVCAPCAALIEMNQIGRNLTLEKYGGMLELIALRSACDGGRTATSAVIGSGLDLVSALCSTLRTQRLHTLDRGKLSCGACDWHWISEILANTLLKVTWFNMVSFLKNLWVFGALEGM